MSIAHAIPSFVAVDSGSAGGSTLAGGVTRWTIDRTRLPLVAV